MQIVPPVLTGQLSPTKQQAAADIMGDLAWRKRWFVLRQGRMSGNPDVLEYYRNSHSKKPIRVIDLNECEVEKHSGSNVIKKEFQNNFVFIVKTTYRTFYLVAKSEEEMQVWVRHITQICNFGHLEDGTGKNGKMDNYNTCILFLE
uniref:GRB2-associated-binding protein 3 n=1 Tax=Sphaerodactylus townsendi TaxID=933632 RepID=A0ACB8FXB1_9SAUR